MTPNPLPAQESEELAEIVQAVYTAGYESKGGLNGGGKQLSPREAKQALTAYVERQNLSERQRYDEIFKWLLGETGEFPHSVKGARYNWRSELRNRLAQLKSKGE